MVSNGGSFSESRWSPSPYQPTLCGETRDGEAEPEGGAEELLWLKTACRKERTDDRPGYSDSEGDAVGTDHPFAVFGESSRESCAKSLVKK